jgi:hypothetical protein
MQQVKEFLNLIDVFFATFWGLILTEVVPILTSGAYVLSSIDNIIKVSFSLVGLVYTVVRMLHFIQMSRLNKEYRRQEIIEKKMNNYIEKSKL